MSAPPVPFQLSDVHVIPAGADAAVVTYRAEGPVRLLATSVWARRDGHWVTVFYQAMPAAPR